VCGPEAPQDQIAAWARTGTPSATIKRTRDFD
jgi:hypothetical protein